jgi:cytochrome c oxidase cbb3-type subunit III
LGRNSKIFPPWGNWTGKFAVGVLATVGIIGLTHAQKKDANAGQAEAKKTFETLCASCHGLDGRGGERGPDLVTRAEVAGKSDAELGRILKEGKTAGGMPPFASFGTRRIAALVSYLRSLQGVRTEAKLPGNPARGKNLFFGKANCSQCHMVSGQGGFWGQDLTRYGGKRGAAEILAVISNPNKDLDPRRGLVTVELADSTRLTGLARNEDNFSLQLQTADGRFHLLSKSEIRSQRYEGKLPMPADYATTLSSSELDDLVSFLIDAANANKGDQSKSESDDFDE